MNNLVEININTANQVYGGRNETIAKLVELIAEGLGSFAKLIYLADKRRRELMLDRINNGDPSLWK